MSALIQESPTLNAQFGKAPTPADMLSLIRSFGGTFTRGSEVIGDPTPETLSASTYTDNLGVIRRPRVGYPRPNFVDGVNKGVLIEEQSTNLTLHSEAFDNAYWLKANVSITPNAIIAPDGNLTADKMVDDATSGEHRVRPNRGALSGSHKYSVFAKAGEYSKVLLGDLTNGRIAKFDLSNGTIISTDTGWSDVKIEPYANGWYRISGTNSTTALFGFGLLNDAGDLVFSGTGTSGAYFWGADDKAGSILTSYIPTAGETVTRGKEELTIPTALDKIPQNNGTIYIKVDMQNLPSTTQALISFNHTGTSGNDSIALYKFGASNLVIDILKGGTTTANVVFSQNTPSVFTATGLYTIVLTYNGTGAGTGDYDVFINGVKSTSSKTTTADINAGNKFAQIKFGRYFDNDFPINNTIKELIILPKALPESQALLLSRI